MSSPTTLCRSTSLPRGAGVTNLYWETAQHGTINADFTLDNRSYVRLIGGSAADYYIGTNTAGATVTVKGKSGFFAMYRNSTSPTAWTKAGIDPSNSNTHDSKITVHVGLPSGAADSTGHSGFILRDKSYTAFGGNQFGNVWIRKLIVEPSVQANAEGYIDILDLGKEAYADIGGIENKNAHPVRLLFTGSGARFFRNNANSNYKPFTVATGKSIVLEGVNGTDINIYKQYCETELTARSGGEVIFRGRDVHFLNAGEKGAKHPNGENNFPWKISSADNVRWQHTGNLHIDGLCWLRTQSDDVLPFGEATGDIVITCNNESSKVPGNANNYLCRSCLDLYGTSQQVNSILSGLNTVPNDVGPRGWIGVVTNSHASVADDSVATQVGVVRLGTCGNNCLLNATCTAGVKVQKEGAGCLDVKNSCGEELDVQGGSARFSHTDARLACEFTNITVAAGASLSGPVTVRGRIVFAVAEGQAVIVCPGLDLSLAGDAKVVVPEGVTLKVQRVAVNGAAKDVGHYEDESWIEGGALDVLYDGRVEELPWTNGGADASASTAANWGRSETPDFSVAGYRPVFATAGTTAAFAGDCYFAGLVFDAPNDFTLTANGPTALHLYEQPTCYADPTFANWPERTYTVEAPVEFCMASQTWVVPSNTTLRLTGGLSSSSMSDITMQGVKVSELTHDYRGGRVELVDAAYNGSFTHQQGGTLYLKGTVGVPGDGGTLTLYNGSWRNGSNMDNGWAELGNTYLDGVTVWKPTVIDS